MSPVMRDINSKGTSSFCLSDDFLITALSADELTQKSKEILELFQDLGIQVNGNKNFSLSIKAIKLLLAPWAVTRVMRPVTRGFYQRTRGEKIGKLKVKTSGIPMKIIKTQQYEHNDNKSTTQIHPPPAPQLEIIEKSGTHSFP